MRHLRAALSRLAGFFGRGPCRPHVRRRARQPFAAAHRRQRPRRDDIRAGAPPRAGEAGGRRVDETAVPRAAIGAAARARGAGPALRRPSARQGAGLHGHGGRDAGARHRRRALDLRLRRRGAGRAAALLEPDATGLRHREHAADPAVEPVVPRLSRLEASDHDARLARRLHRPRVVADDIARHRAGGRRARERRLLPDAGRRADPGARLLCRRGSAGQGRDGHHLARGVAWPLRRPARCDRPGRRAERRAAHHRRRAAGAIPVRGAGGRGGTGRRCTRPAGARRAGAATTCSVSAG